MTPSTTTETIQTKNSEYVSIGMNHLFKFCIYDKVQLEVHHIGSFSFVAILRSMAIIHHRVGDGDIR